MSFVLKKKISLEEPLDLLSPPTPPLALTPAQLINLEESLEYFKLAWHAGWRQYGQQAPDGNLDFKIGISAIFFKKLHANSDQKKCDSLCIGLASEYFYLIFVARPLWPLKPSAC